MDIGYAVHVAADPAAEAQDARQLEASTLQPVDVLEPQLELLVKHRHDVIDDFGQIEQDVLAFVRDCQSLPWMFFRLPPRGHLEADPVHHRPPLCRRQGRVDPLDHQLGDALLVAQDRPSG